MITNELRGDKLTTAMSLKPAASIRQICAAHASGVSTAPSTLL